MEQLPRSVVELVAVTSSAEGDPLPRNCLLSLPSLRSVVVHGPVKLFDGTACRFPPSVTHLSVGRRWGHHLSNLSLPPELRTLILPDAFFNDEYDRYEEEGENLLLPPLPSSLTHLDLGKKWNAAQLPPLPPALRFLNLASYAGPLDALQLPDSVLHLSLNRSSIDGLRLPPFLRSLYGTDWAQEFDGAAELRGQLPPTLTELHALRWTLPLHQQLPPALTDLRICKLSVTAEVADCPLQLHLPSLRTLQLEKESDGFPMSALRLPATLTELIVSNSCQLPDVSHTAVSQLAMGALDLWQPHSADWYRCLPPTLRSFAAPPLLPINESLNPLLLHVAGSLTELDLRTSRGDTPFSRHAWHAATLPVLFPISLHSLHWPPLLRKLTFGHWFTGALTAASWTPPAQLEELRLPDNDEFGRDALDRLLLPPALRVLHTGCRNRSLRLLQSLPPSLRELHLGREWNQPVGELPTLPSQLHLLAFGEGFNQPVAALQLPPSLLELSFPARFEQPLEELQLPDGLQRLSFGHSSDRTIRQRRTLPRLPPSLRLLQAPKMQLNVEFASLDLPRHCVLDALRSPLESAHQGIQSETSD
jgi:hypothetical protein